MTFFEVLKSQCGFESNILDAISSWNEELIRQHITDYETISEFLSCEYPAYFVQQVLAEIIFEYSFGDYGCIDEERYNEDRVDDIRDIIYLDDLFIDFEEETLNITIDKEVFKNTINDPDSDVEDYLTDNELNLVIDNLNNNTPLKFKWNGN
jgi:hypothetical protein